MRSFVGIAGAPADETLLRHLAKHIRLPSWPEPQFKIDGELATATVGEQEISFARDPFGVRPFFYTRIDRGIIFSDSLDAVLAHPATKIDLDDDVVADYLTTGTPNDAAATIYKHVRRLPPAHTFRWHNGELTIERNWSLREPPRVAGDDAPARLAAALKAAIRDRVHATSAVVFMSGGLDSTTLAALTREALPHVRLTAETSVYRTRIADVEEQFAIEAARSIGIPIHCTPLDDYAPLDSLERGLWTADPGALLTAGMTRDLYARFAELAPVALHGHPADAVLAFQRHSSRWLLRRKRRAASPPAWLRVTRTIRKEPKKPLAIRALESPMWSSFCEWAHPLQTRAPIEVTYPWSDPRVIETVLAMPPVPWRVDKYVVRELLRGRVSETIRLRRKTPLQGDPWTTSLPAGLDIEAASPYIDRDRFRDACRAAGMLSDTTLRAVAFEYWLRNLPERVRVLQAE